MLKVLTILALWAFTCGFAMVTDLKTKQHLLGSKECTWGPSYWCSNLTNAAGCHATKHCIQTVWTHKTYPEDTDSICQTCVEMVKEARDQLESNETQEEIKEVFDGSCKLIPLKVVSNECCQLADQFIPDLVDTLASQMNPQVVCSVAGLCNNAKIDKLLEESQNKEPLIVKPEIEEYDTCSGCHKVIDIAEKKFNSLSKDDFLEQLLELCGRMDSFADSCSNIIIVYFNDIYTRMKNEFKGDNICIMSGECSINYHVHSNVEITPMGKVGVVQIAGGDDPACKLCKQLVGHLRDLLIADTTEVEFQKVLQGICKQTGNFKDECTSIVDEYYPVIYRFLVDELNTTEVCQMASICPGPGKKPVPIAPLLNPQATQALKEAFEKQTPEMMQLPIERLNSPHVNNIFNKEVCTFCEYFLHYLQQAITDPKNEGEIKEAVDHACEKLPNSVTETCVEFVNSYGEAFMALLAEEVDPSTICPLIRVCPGLKGSQDIEIFMQQSSAKEPNCPLCLFAVTKLEEMVKDEKTKDNIKNALDHLCIHLNDNLKEECQDFVSNYTDELLEMLVDDFKPQEICVYLKLCKDERPAPTHDFVHGGSISTNEIIDFTANGRPFVSETENKVSNKPECPLCEFIMEKLETDLENKHTKEEIEAAIHGVCKVMPKVLRDDCNKWVDKYAEVVLDLLIASANPDEICQMLNMCEKKMPHLLQSQGPKTEEVFVGSPQCVICKIVMKQIESMIGDIDEADLEHAVKTVCQVLPRSQEQSCDEFIAKNGQKIYELLSLAVAPGEVCSLMFLCNGNPIFAAIKNSAYTCAVCETTVSIIDDLLANPNVDRKVDHILDKTCIVLPKKHQRSCARLIDTYGERLIHYVSTYSASNACKELGICQRAAKVKREVLVGSEKCTWGPGYWCQSEENAKECGHGAHTHCKTKVWKADKPPQN